MADLHAETGGLKAVVLSPEAIYNEFSSGTPGVTAFRKVLKMWYDRASENDGRYARYCLIFSRLHTTINVCRPLCATAAIRVCRYGNPTDSEKHPLTPTGDYIGMLGDNKTNLSMNLQKSMWLWAECP